MTIANNVADLVDGRTLVPIQQDETGALQNQEAWTGTTADGRRADDQGVTGKGTCDSWQTTSAQGMSGKSSEVDGRWTNDNDYSACTTPRHLYCFED